MGITIRRHVSKPTERSRIVCVQTPPLPLSKKRRRGWRPFSNFYWGEGVCTQARSRMSAVFSRWNKKVEIVGSVLTFPLLSNSLFDKSKSPFLGLSLCCGNHCWFAFVLWYFYYSMSFQPVALRGLVIAPCRQHHETSPFHECGTLKFSERLTKQFLVCNHVTRRPY